MKMSKDGFVANHLNDFNMVTSQLSYIGVNFDDDVKDLLILFSLPQRWDGLIIMIHPS
jgi:hypothetical protein